MSVDFPTPDDPSSTPCARGRAARRARRRCRRAARWRRASAPGRRAAHDGERGLEVGDEIGLVEHEHDVAAAGRGHGHQALKAARVEVAVGGGDDEGDVDVGGELLADARPARRGAAVGVDDAPVVDGDPVADGRVLGHAARDDGERLAVRAGDHQAAAVDGDHARGRAAVGSDAAKARRRFAPAEVFEVQGALQARCGLDGGNDRQHRGGEQAGVEVAQQRQTLLRLPAARARPQEENDARRVCALMASIYDQIGGGPAVAAAVDDLYARVQGDRKLAHYFTGVDMGRQKTHLRAFVAAALGGPQLYAGRDMRAAHGGLRITAAAFDGVVGASRRGAGRARRGVRSHRRHRQDARALRAEIATARR